ncbi:hypothetical protein JKP88DRAFT_285667 [Tribonema minus]|uniref:Uncharacterized protein n=1 Tax=Tribonema minus TaxID=303371 RepID=A0A835ZBT5_9STRA|nr:hypothetical protein JKP88DRAFT_285667 [Tribonema minus]
MRTAAALSGRIIFTTVTHLGGLKHCRTLRALSLVDCSLRAAAAPALRSAGARSCDSRLDGTPEAKGEAAVARGAYLERALQFQDQRLDGTPLAIGESAAAHDAHFERALELQDQQLKQAGDAVVEWLACITKLLIDVSAALRAAFLAGDGSSTQPSREARTLVERLWRVYEDSLLHLHKASQEHWEEHCAALREHPERRPAAEHCQLLLSLKQDTVATLHDEVKRMLSAAPQAAAAQYSGSSGDSGDIGSSGDHSGSNCDSWLPAATMVMAAPQRRSSNSGGSASTNGSSSDGNSSSSSSGSSSSNDSSGSSTSAGGSGVKRRAAGRQAAAASGGAAAATDVTGVANGLWDAYETMLGSFLEDMLGMRAQQEQSSDQPMPVAAAAAAAAPAATTAAAAAAPAAAVAAVPAATAAARVAAAAAAAAAAARSMRRLAALKLLHDRIVHDFSKASMCSLLDACEVMRSRWEGALLAESFREQDRLAKRALLLRVDIFKGRGGSEVEEVEVEDKLDMQLAQAVEEWNDAHQQQATEIGQVRVR